MGKLANKIFARAVSKLNLPFVDLSSGYANNSKWHQGLIIHLASILRPRVYLELGIFKCGLFNRMIQFAEQVIESLSRKSEQFEMMTLPWHPGLTLCRKRTAQLAWQENSSVVHTSK